MTKFLVMLATQTDYNLQGLRFRLDFNEYYEQKEPILSSPQVRATVGPLFNGGLISDHLCPVTVVLSSVQ